MALETLLLHPRLFPRLLVSTPLLESKSIAEGIRKAHDKGTLISLFFLIDFVGANYTNNKAQPLTVGFANCSWYWTKVFGNVAKQIYIKEGLTPPNASEFRKVYDDAVKQGLLLVRDPKRYSTSLLRVAQTSTSGDYLKYGCYLIQILGFFALGEIVGRRKLAGYPDYGPKNSD